MKRDEAIKVIQEDILTNHNKQYDKYREALNMAIYDMGTVKQIKSERDAALSERKWYSCDNPPNHHNDVIVRGVEALSNKLVYKVMQWDVDAWRPTNYAPSIIWKEWSEI